jgi:hypothetical protein
MQCGQLPYVVLAITVCVKDQFFGGVLKAGAQGRSVAPIVRMLNDPELRVGARQRFEYNAGGVGASVVNYDHLVVSGQTRQNLERVCYQQSYRPRVIEGRKEDADARPVILIYHH